MREAQLARALVDTWTNCRSLYAALPEVESGRVGRALWTRIDWPLPNLNCVIGDDLGATDRWDLDRRVDQLIDGYRRLRRSMSWWLGLTDSSRPLVTALEARGFQMGRELTGMALDLSRLSPAPPPRIDAALAPVTDPATLARFCRLWTQSMHSPSGSEEFMRRAYGQWRLGPDDPYRHWTAQAESRVVATASYQIVDRLATVDLVSTDSDWRSRGLASHLLTTLLREAADRGGKWAILQATEAGRPVYHRLGFVDIIPMASLRLDLD